MDSTLETTSTASPSIINATNVFKPDDIVPSIAVNNNISNNSNISNSNQFKKCIHHRMSHCGRTGVAQSQQRVVRVGNGSAVITSGSNSGGSVAGATGNSSSSVAGQQNNGAINTQVGIQSQPGLVQPVSAALLADRYLLLDLVDGSSLYRCIDVRSHDELVCKVNIFHYFH